MVFHLNDIHIITKSFKFIIKGKMSSKGKVIFVVTNYGEALIKGGKTTGWYLPEAAHPYKVIEAAGYEITFVSPKGGKAPMVSPFI